MFEMASAATISAPCPPKSAQPWQQKLTAFLVKASQKTQMEILLPPSYLTFPVPFAKHSTAQNRITGFFSSLCVELP